VAGLPASQKRETRTHVIPSSHIPAYISSSAPATHRLLLVLMIVVFLFFPSTAVSDMKPELSRHLTAIAESAPASPMLQVPEGWFLMGTNQTTELLFESNSHYDDTEQPQRRVWLDRYEMDRDEVSLGQYLASLQRQQRTPSPELQRLIWHMVSVHAVSDETLARWPALYLTWAEASQFCLAQGKRLPTEAEWEKAARGSEANLFPWGHTMPEPGLATFGQYHVHEIPIVAPTDSGEQGRSPYGMYHMAGNAAEWVQDWFGIDYYKVMPERNPPGPHTGRYKVVRGGSWKSAPALLRTATRGGASPDQRSATVGVRCARSLTQ